jgi:hypothetical protein
LQAYLKATGFAGGGGGPDAADALAAQLAPLWTPGLASVELPAPLGCFKPYCEHRHAQCFSTYTPRSPAADLAALAVRPSGSFGGSSSGNSSSSRSSSGSGDGVGGGTAGEWPGLPVVLDAGPGQYPRGTWAVSLPPGADFAQHAAFGYLDFKFSLRGSPTSGWLALRFTSTLPHSPLVACQPQCPWGKCKGGQRLLSDASAVAWTLDGQPLTLPKPEALPQEDKAFQKEGVCVVLGRAGAAGAHELAAKVLDGTVFMSHLLFF